MTALTAFTKHVGYSTAVTDATLFPSSELKHQINLPSTATDDDTWIASAVSAARSLLERSVPGGLAIRLQTKQLVLNKFPSSEYGEIELPFSPLVSSSSEITITYYDGNNSSTTLATSDYRLINPGNGYRAKLYPAIDKTWPVSKSRQDAVTIEFSCGSTNSSNVPPTIKHAMNMLVTHWYENRSALVVGTITKEIELGLETLLMANGYGFYG